MPETRQSEDDSSGSDEGAGQQDAASSSYYCVEPSAFDNLDWDVECPAQVWKLLRYCVGGGRCVCVCVCTCV